MNNDNYDYYDESVYVDEPIIKKKENVILPKKIKEARALEAGQNIYSNAQQLFYLQGKILEDYEENEFNCSENFNYYYYFPSYARLSNNALRSYFVWRTNLRKGKLRKTWIIFANLYMSELINQIGVNSPEQGYDELKYFIEAYKELDYSIYSYASRFLNEYIVYYNLDQSSFEGSQIIFLDSQIQILVDITNNNQELTTKYNNKQIIQAFNTLSSYKITNSPFYKKNPDDMEIIVINSFTKIVDYFNHHHKRSFFEDTIGYYNNQPYRMFYEFDFYDRMKYSTYEYYIDSIRYYTCKNGKWFNTGFNLYNVPNKKLRDILKIIDSIARDKYKFKKTIKKPYDLKWMNKIISDTIDNLLNEKTKVKPIEIDYSQLNKIRIDAEKTKGKLIIPDEIEEEVQDEIDNRNDDFVTVIKNPIKVIDFPTVKDLNQQNSSNLVSQNNLVELYHLTSDESRLLDCLIYNKEYSWIKQEGKMLSVIVDRINEKLFDFFNDTIISIDLNEIPTLIEEYIDELKGMIK